MRPGIDIGLKDRSAPVVVAMSGGVDSAVTAALLVEAGYTVIGVTLQLYDHGRAVGRPGSCCAGQDIHDARRVADTLGIAHYVLDYEQRFRAAVIDDFADSYLRGETPIPCIRCNQRVKFEDLLATARRLGAAALATGHYARRVERGGSVELHRGQDKGRDQSYFLFAMTGDQLAYLRFPLGGMEKAETRHHAARLGLAIAEKPDSQDICFVPEGRYAQVVERLRPEAHRPGAIVDLKGHELGRHHGVAQFTVGQRRGLGIASAEPFYVVRIEPETNQVVVGPASALATRVIRLRDLNWIGEPPKGTVAVMAKVRSTHPGARGAVTPLADGSAELVFAEPERAVAPGQACVLYDGDRVLGGGWIMREAASTGTCPALAAALA
ncbi:MAG: tRNA 2-thiouridine(34) synthase MnmA [Alphaproteobacteria bacterium]